MACKLSQSADHLSYVVVSVQSLCSACSCIDYVPVGIFSSFPCLPSDVELPSWAAGLKRLFKLMATSQFVQMVWFDDGGVKVAPFGGSKPNFATRVYVNSGNNLTMIDPRPENTGRYLCVARANDADGSIVNMLRINGQFQQPANSVE